MVQDRKVRILLPSSRERSGSLIDRYFLTTSRDMTARMYTLDPVEGFKPKSFGGHRDIVLGAWFSDDEKTVSDLLGVRIDERYIQ